MSKSAVATGAVRKFCNCDDIGTPISSDDEQVRNSLGYQGPVNYDADDRCDALKNLGITGNFKNHIHSKEIYENIGENLFKNTVKIAIHRDPLDFLISQYFYSIK